MREQETKITAALLAAPMLGSLTFSIGGAAERSVAEQGKKIAFDQERKKPGLPRNG